MPKPVKIKKAKSFMFTTKHHSFLGVLGCVMCVISAATMTFSIYLAFINAGKSTVAIGGMSLFALILSFIGIISGIVGLPERDIHKWEPITSIIANSAVLALWITLVIYGA